MEIRYSDGILNGKRRVLVQWDERGPFMTLDEDGNVGEVFTPSGSNTDRRCEACCDGWV